MVKGRVRLIAAACLVLPATGGLIFWRQDLTEAKLIEASEREVKRVAITPYVRPRVTPRLLKRTLGFGQADVSWTMEYEAIIHREPIVRVDPRGIHPTGDLVVPVSLIMTGVNGKAVVGSWWRPVWVNVDPMAINLLEAEEVWSRIDTEPANASFDACYVINDWPHCAEHVVFMAGARRLGLWKDIAFDLNEPDVLDPNSGWTPVWAGRLKSELDAIEKALNDGTVPKEDQAMISDSLKRVKSGPELAEFRKVFHAKLAEL